MADNGRAMKWTGYGSLAQAYELPGPAYEPASPSQSYVCSSPVVPQTPPMWNSPYSAASPLETASPMTPMSSIALWSPTAFHSPQLSSSKPPHFSNYATTPSPSFGSQRPLSPSGSPFASRHPTRLSAEQAIGRQLRPGPLVPQRAYSAPFSAGNKPMQVEFRLESGGTGVPMRLLQDAGANDLPIEGADTSPFSESVASTITLRIWWPGYVQYSRRMTMRKATGLLTRCELAMAVSEVFKEFIEEAREDPNDPGQSKWRIGRGRITVNDLVLLRLYQVSQGSWQADVRLEAER